MMETENNTPQESVDDVIYRIERSKLSRPEPSWFLPSLIIAALLIAGGVFLGIMVHKANTPVFDGTLTGKTPPILNFADSSVDTVFVSRDGLVQASRTVYGGEGYITAKVTGEWKEKPGKFVIKFDKSTAKYAEGSPSAKNEKGRDISARRLIDSKIIVRKKSVSGSSAVINVKRKVSVKDEWVEVRMNRTRP